MAEKKTFAILEIDENGDIHCIYTDEINLFSIGRVTQIRKASNVEFNETEQCWNVSSLKGEILHKNKNRQAAIDWEIISFSPGGKYYECQW